MSREVLRGLRQFVTIHHFKFYFHRNVETVTLFQMVGVYEGVYEPPLHTVFSRFEPVT